MGLAWEILLLASVASLAAAQSNCLALSGSSACPGFASQYVNPANLSALYPFFSSVTDVTSFDSGLLNYVNGTFKSVKYNTDLGCSNTSSAWSLQYARTFLCGEFVTRSYAAGCTQAASQVMTCQATCLQFAVSENLLVSDATACGTNTIGTAARQSNLTYDFTTCTDWTSLISNNTATCVLGQNNEANCGFGTNVGQLCSFCNPSLKGGNLVDSCCAMANTNLGTCGYTLNAAQVAASPTPSATAGMASSTGAGAASEPGATAVGAGSGSGAGSGTTSSASGGGSSGLSGGAIAGIVIGCIAGILLLVAALLFFLARRRKASRDPAARFSNSGRAGLLSAAAGTSGYADEKGYSKEALAAKQRKFAGEDSPPSPVSSGTLGFSGRESEDSRALAGSGKSSPSLTAVAAGALAGYGAGTAGAVAATSGAAGAAGATGDAAARGGTGERPISQETTGSGSSNERNLVNSVRDQYSSADIVPGSEVVAIYAYEPNLPDELRLQPDSVITVKKIYDDGWAVGTQHGTDGIIHEGAFPLVVCTVIGADSDANSSDSSYNTSGNAMTASEVGGSRPARSNTSRRTSSIGDQSFESAPSHMPSAHTQADQSQKSGSKTNFLSSFFRRSD